MNYEIVYLQKKGVSLNSYRIEFVASTLEEAHDIFEEQTQDCDAVAAFLYSQYGTTSLRSWQLSDEF